MGYPLSYYLGLVTSQHQNKPKFTALLSGLLQMLTDSQMCIESLDQSFDVDYAVGVQLDTLGSIVGISRHLPFTLTGGGSVLPDADFRILIKAKAALNRWDGRTDSLQSDWANIFPGNKITVIDDFGMTMSITLASSFSLNIRDCINNDMVIPRPEGVLLSSTDLLPIFGFDTEDTSVSGWDVGKW